ncbi:MAG: FAD-binding and (Fe-S)-binding domain-containing protein, partial [Anaerolineales bacterium]
LTFDSEAEACDATPGLLETEPAAVELLPRTVLQQARLVPAYSRKLGFVEGDPAALLIVEYTGDTLAEAQAAAGATARRGRILATAQAQADLWAVRKVGLGLLMSVPGDRKPITFIEDVAVPVERLGEYVREVERILAAHGTYGEWYAHASAGCLHMRPLINLKTADGVSRMRAIADQIVSLVMWMGGSLSGEHGDGLSHTEFNSALFGPTVIEAFRAIKGAFDPKGLLNPGKVVPLPEGTRGAAAVDADLRYGAGYRSENPRTTFAFAREGGFAGAVEACNGAGVCRKDGGVMCPSFQATRDETHSTRGRANALRAALSGVLPPGSLTSLQMHQVLDLCLECKGCKAECPTSVDMARLKAEFLAMHQAKYGVPIRSRFFGEARRLGAVAHRFAGVVNSFNRSALGKAVLQKVLRIAPQRRLPEYASRTFLDRWQDRGFGVAGEPVVLFVDSFTNYHHPELGMAAVQVLEASGFQVQVDTRQACCGRTMISKGLLTRAKRVARLNLEVLDHYAGNGTRIVGLEPSCLLTLRDEYLDFFPEDPRAERVAHSSRLIEELLTEGEVGERPIDRLKVEMRESPIFMHGHCHAKSLVGSAAALEMLRAASRHVQEIESGCCGMAGSFGYEVEHYDLSMQIGGLTLFPAVREAQAQGATIAAAGFSCRSQIYDGTGATARHPIEILAEALVPGAD